MLIEELGLSKRITKALLRAGKYSVDDLLDEREIMIVRNLSVLSVLKIRKVLEERGIFTTNHKVVDDEFHERYIKPLYELL